MLKRYGERIGSEHLLSQTEKPYIIFHITNQMKVVRVSRGSGSRVPLSESSSKSPEITLRYVKQMQNGLKRFVLGLNI